MQGNHEWTTLTRSKCTQPFSDATEMKYVTFSQFRTYILHIFIDSCIMVLFFSFSATSVSKSSWIQTFWYQYHAFVTYLSWDITVSIYCTISRDCWLVTARTNKRRWVKRWLPCYFLFNAVTQTTYIAHNSHHWIAIEPLHSFTKAIISYNANIAWRCSFGASLVQLSARVRRPSCTLASLCHRISKQNISMYF